MVGVLRFKNSETGEWQEINAIKGEPGKDYVLTEADKEEIAQSVGTDNFYTKSEVDTKFDEFKGGYEPDNASIILTGEQTLSVSDEWLNGKLPTYSRGLNYNPDTNTVAVKVSSPLKFGNNGALTLNENNLFMRGSTSFIVHNNWNEPLVATDEVIVFDVEPSIVADAVNEFFINAENQTLAVYILFDGGRLGGTTAPTYYTSTAGFDGVQYDVLLDMSKVLSPNTQANTGVIGLQVGYVNNTIYFIVKRNVNVNTPNFTGAQFGKITEESSLAHYWIGNRNQFSMEKGNLYIRDSYILDVVQNGLPVAEGVSV